VEFEWDENKNTANIEKHGIDFRDAQRIWDKTPIEINRSSERGEERIVVVGELEGICLTVVYTERPRNIRIISARASHRKERQYRDLAIGRKHRA
jgi:uncharacterized DUF497 family protein